MVKKLKNLIIINAIKFQIKVNKLDHNNKVVGIDLPCSFLYSFIEELMRKTLKV